MRADGKLHLEEKLIDRAADVTVADAAQLAAKLTEFRRPEGERRLHSAIGECVRAEVAGNRAIGSVDAQTGEPALRDLSVGRRVEASQFSIDIGAIVADQLQTPDERFVKPLHQWLPAIGHVNARELVRAAARARERAARIARAHLDVAVLRDVAEPLEMRVVEQVALRAALENILNVAFEDLAAAFEE